MFILTAIVIWTVSTILLSKTTDFEVSIGWIIFLLVLPSILMASYVLLHQIYHFLAENIKKRLIFSNIDKIIFNICNFLLYCIE